MMMQTVAVTLQHSLHGTEAESCKVAMTAAVLTKVQLLLLAALAGCIRLTMTLQSLIALLTTMQQQQQQQ
jgi:hypothetical protein